MATRLAAVLLLGAVAGAAWANADASRSAAAVAEYCYAGLFTVYTAYYYRAGTADKACLELEYKRTVSAGSLAKATWKSFADRHGQQAMERFRPILERIAEAYREADKNNGYRYCLDDKAGGSLFHGSDPLPLLQFDDANFARMYMQIWVRAERDGQPEWAFRDCS